ncbi:MAG: GTP-binding protein, partial [Myxococcota bacterium]
GREYMLIDTAGLRRKSSVREELEQFSVIQAIRSLDRADVAVLVIDAAQGLTAQDKKIAGVVANRGRACIIAVNKWDLIERDTHTADEWVKSLRHEMPFIAWAPIVTTSVVENKRVHKLLGKVDEVFDRFTKRVPTADLNRFLEQALAMHSPPVVRNRRLKFYYVSQVATRPPSFVYMVNYPKSVPASYKRFLENRLREQYDFDGTPVRTMVRARRRTEWD